MLSGAHCWNRFNPCPINLSIKKVSMLVLMENNKRRKLQGLMIQNWLLWPFLQKWRGMLFMGWVCPNSAIWLRRLNLFMNPCVKIFRTRFRCRKFADFGLKAKKKKGRYWQNIWNYFRAKFRLSAVTCSFLHQKHFIRLWFVTLTQ